MKMGWLLSPAFAVCFLISTAAAQLKDPEHYIAQKPTPASKDADNQDDDMPVVKSLDDLADMFDPVAEADKAAAKQPEQQGTGVERNAPPAPRVPGLSGAGPYENRFPGPQTHPLPGPQNSYAMGPMAPPLLQPQPLNVQPAPLQTPPGFQSLCDNLPFCAARPLCDARPLARPRPSCGAQASDCSARSGYDCRGDCCFNCFISPTTNPLYFEDPRILNEARLVYMYNAVPEALGGGQIQYIGLQLRAALTPRLSILINRLGFFSTEDVNAGGAVASDGFSDFGIGLKYNLIADAANQRLLSVGLTYDAPTGEVSALQGADGGDINMFLSYGRQIGDRWHWISTPGARFGTDSARSDIFYWSNHIDFRATQRTYLFAEVNYYHVFETGSGSFGENGVNGLDLYNLGSTAGADLDDVTTAAIGVKFKPTSRMELGFAYEAPISSEDGLMDNRLTADWAFRF